MEASFAWKAGFMDTMRSLGVRCLTKVQAHDVTSCRSFVPLLCLEKSRVL